MRVEWCEEDSACTPGCVTELACRLYSRAVGGGRLPAAGVAGPPGAGAITQALMSGALPGPFRSTLHFVGRESVQRGHSVFENKLLFDSGICGAVMARWLDGRRVGGHLRRRRTGPAQIRGISPELCHFSFNLIAVYKKLPRLNYLDFLGVNCPTQLVFEKFRKVFRCFLPLLLLTHAPPLPVFVKECA